MNMKPIVDAYVRRILRGTITIDDVPDTIREDVRKALDNYRYVQNEGVGGVIATHSFIYASHLSLQYIIYLEISKK